MSIELIVLTLGCILAIVHVGVAGSARTRQYGRAWNMGARDEALPPLAPVPGRLLRAQANFFETFPVLIAAILMVEVTGANDGRSAAGAILWLVARAIYLPLYGFGVPKVRTLVWLAALLGIAMILSALLL
jgi:uncharacterized MAPEG superfamily protein